MAARDQARRLSSDRPEEDRTGQRPFDPPCSPVSDGAPHQSGSEVRAGLHACSRLPVFRRTVMTMGPDLPIAILPGIVTELGRVFELLLRNIGPEAPKRLIVSQA
jgi:hypothetical protein